jgi:hypothetical protein
MRAFAAALLAIGLSASPILANNANEPGKEDTPAAVSSAPAVPDKPVATLKPEGSVIESEMQDLRNLVEEQRAELAEQRATLKALEEKLGATPSEPASAAASAPVVAQPSTIAASPSAISISPNSPATPAIGGTSKTLATSAAAFPQGASEPNKDSFLYFKIGAAEFYPLGFMDATSIFRTTNMTTQGGGSIGTSFGAIPFNNTVLGRSSEVKFSAQNSRIGLRTHAKFGDADVTGYLESDFLGYLAPSGNVTSNSDSLRLRLYWVDVKKGMWEVLGGQSWSLLTPNRVGLSALPGDLFYGQEMDTNYYLGLTYTRAAGIRVILHPTTYWAIGASIENPQQTLPSTVIIPSTVPAAGQGNNYGGQFDSNSGNTSNAVGVNNTSIPNLAPDLIVKSSLDLDPGGHHMHFDVAGLLRTFRAVNLVNSPGTNLTPNNTNYSTINGGGIAATANVELIKNLRLITTGYWSYAGGRYIGNTTGPDVIVKANGGLSGIHSGSGLGGFEYQVLPKLMLYSYYSFAYFGKNTTANPGSTTLAGYGFAGSNNSSDRYLYEGQIGFVHTLWRNANYGDLKTITQYAYVSRAPWSIASGQPGTAHTSMVYIDLRYDLP